MIVIIRFIVSLMLQLTLKKGFTMAFEYAIVLTGGIATGKSTVANFFTDYGFTIIDADKIAHKILDKQHLEIAQLFGNQYIQNNTVNRKALGELIFSSPSDKKRLEDLLHPLIYQEIERQALTLDKIKNPYLIDIPLFFETKRYPIKDAIVVYTPQNMQLTRLIERDNSNEENAMQRIQSQLNIEEKKELASYVIDNSLDLKHLKQECDRIKNVILT